MRGCDDNPPGSALPGCCAAAGASSPVRSPQPAPDDAAPTTTHAGRHARRPQHIQPGGDGSTFFRSILATLPRASDGSFRCVGGWRPACCAIRRCEEEGGARAPCAPPPRRQPRRAPCSPAPRSSAWRPRRRVLRVGSLLPGAAGCRGGTGAGGKAGRCFEQPHHRPARRRALAGAACRLPAAGASDSSRQQHPHAVARGQRATRVLAPFSSSCCCTHTERPPVWRWSVSGPHP